ncbi:MAG: tyrosine-protein phosphatase [Lentisphaerae bacterium]|nr:tyrosine-protein phosphatase [Lentisphaerota bacterium]
MKSIASILLAMLTLLEVSAAVELIAPADNSTVSLARYDWREQVRTRSKRPIVPTNKFDLADNMALPVPVVLVWQNNGGTGNALIETSPDKDFSSGVRTYDAGIGNHFELYNLETGRVYFWRVKLIKNGQTDAVSAIRCFRTAGNTPRFFNITTPAPANFRDIGGYQLPNGKRIKQGMVFRGSELDSTFKLSGANKDFMLNELKIRTDLDLRQTKEVRNRKQSELGPQVKWLLRPLNAYNGFTPEQLTTFAAALKVFAAAENYPIYVHCSGGADRTGEIIFLLDMLLGMDEETALLEYETTSLSYYPRPRNIKYFQQWLNGLRKFGAPGDTMQQAVEKYFLAIGFTEQEIAAIRENLTGK